jgi:diadenosine tetraphosphate (Ap4A) HIT family hydrolase
VDRSTCLFCRLGSDADHQVYLRNGTCYAQLDKHPANPGHVLIIPLRHVDSFFDLTSQEMHDAYVLLDQARKRLTEEYQPDGWNIGINDGVAAGRTVHHLHIHLIPRHFGDMPDPRAGIRRGLPNGNPDAWSRKEER